jgi:hypothetical protein
MTLLVSSLSRKKMVDKNKRIWWIISGQVRVSEEVTSKNLNEWFPDDVDHLQVKEVKVVKSDKEKSS